MAAPTFFDPFPQAIDSSGDPIPGAKLKFEIAGTTQLITTYSDGGLSTENDNPVIADSSGRFGPIFLQTTTFKVTLLDASDVILSVKDNVEPSSTGGFSIADVPDNIFRIVGSSDATKKLAFEVDANVPTGTTVTLTAPNASGDMLVSSVNVDITGDWDFTGTTTFGSDGASAEPSLTIIPVASSDNGFSIVGATTGNAPSLRTIGDDTNIDFTIEPKGTGVVHLLDSSSGVASHSPTLLLESGKAMSIFEFSGPATSTQAIYFSDVDARGRLEYSHTTDSFSLWTNAVSRFTINSSGLSGFGLTDPKEMVSAAGNVQAGGIVGSVTDITTAFVTVGGAGTQGQITLSALQTNRALSITTTADAAVFSYAITSDNGARGLLFQRGAASALSIVSNGDITLFEDDGTTAALFLDSSNGRIGYGTLVPDTVSHITAADPFIRIENTTNIGDSGSVQVIGGVEFEGVKSGVLRVVAQIIARASGTWSGATANFAPTSLEFYTQDNSTDDGTALPRLIIFPTGTQFIANTQTVPSSSPTGGGQLYVEGGALKYRGSSGTITTLGVA